jgi:hypothetical protein
VPTAYESAQLNLKLFELRQDPLLRDARGWFFADFNPESFGELAAIASGEKNSWFRMVLGYWDMAASLVTTGAIDGDAFRAAILTTRRATAAAVGKRRRESESAKAV